MNKKFYAKPTLDVVEYDMTQVICTSLKVGGGTFNEEVKPGDGTGSSAPRSKERGIWDED
ncbi:MAG: hypothetical protein IKX59_06545 [Bacteroidales bacterium]|nr:hypothetical protein [Bacteroidales bacterium]